MAKSDDEFQSGQALRRQQPAEIRNPELAAVLQKGYNSAQQTAFVCLGEACKRFDKPFDRILAQL